MAEHLGRDRASLALIDNRVLLAIFSRTDRFEGGSMLKPLYDPARIETFLEEFGLLFELADALGSALRLERARASATPAETSHPEIQHGFRGL